MPVFFLFICDYSVDGEESHYDKNFLMTLNENGVPPHVLPLRGGDYVMLVRNYSLPDKLSNGSKLKLLKFNSSRKTWTVKSLATGEIHEIPRIHFEINHRNRRQKLITFKMVRRQYPFRLCYAMSINKSQGQTLARVGVDLSHRVFSHGQLYVALGRVSRRRDILARVNEEDIGVLKTRAITMNRVHRALLDLTAT